MNNGVSEKMCFKGDYFHFDFLTQVEPTYMVLSYDPLIITTSKCCDYLCSYFFVLEPKMVDERRHLIFAGSRRIYHDIC